MRKNELQKILKPLIKECIKEVIFEDGVLSGLISEIVQGLGQQTIVESVEPKQPESDFLETQRANMRSESIEAMKKKRKKLEESMGTGFSGIFEDTEPLSAGGSLKESVSNSPLSSYSPEDAGVDITAIMSLGGAKIWKNMN
jgi:hypothetical protein